MNGVLIRVPAGALSRSLAHLGGGQNSVATRVDQLLPSDGRQRRTIYLIAAAVAVLSLLAITLLAVDAVVRVAVASVTIWAPAGLLHGVNLRLLLARKKRNLSLPAQLDRLKSISMRDGVISGEIPKERLGAGDSPFYLAAVVTAAVGCFQLHQAVGEGKLSGLIGTLGLPLPFSVALPLATVITVGLVGVIQSAAGGTGRLQTHLAAKLRGVLDPLNAQIATASVEWNQLEAEIAALAKSLCIRPPDAQLPKILGGLEHRLAGICVNSPSICRELWAALEEARTDRAELKIAWALSQSVEAAANAAAPALTGAPEVVSQALVRYRQRVSEPETLDLLIHRNWAAYRLMMRMIREEIECLPEIGARLRSEPRQEPPPQAKVIQQQGRSDRDHAYAILRLPGGASAQEIQRAYRWLSSIWHPDRRLAKDDEEMKSINWAYKYLKNVGDA